MADLEATDVTITVQTGTPWNPRIEGHKRKVLVSIAFGDGAKTYPAGGVPLPTYSSWGLVRNLEYLTLIDPDDASGIVWKHDKTNHKLRGYYRGAITPSGTVSQPTFSGAASAAAVLAELASGSYAPAAQTLFAEACGW